MEAENASPSTGLHREHIARIRKVEEQIRDIGLLAIGSGAPGSAPALPASVAKRQNGATPTMAEYDGGRRVCAC